MYENPQFNENNEKILCEMNGKNADMLMNIKTKLLKAGESFTICDANNETAILLLSGDVTYKFDGKEENAKRANQFVDRPYCVHFSKNNTVTVIANADSRILIQQTDNANDFGVVWYSPENVILQEVLDLCIDYYETTNYIFVHGWIPIIENCYFYDKDWRHARTERWEKARWCNPVDMFKYEVYEPNKTIVCGHWHCSAFWHTIDPSQYDEFGENENFDPFISDKVIALDACTAYSKKVNVLIVED